MTLPYYARPGEAFRPVDRTPSRWLLWAYRALTAAIILLSMLRRRVVLADGAMESLRFDRPIAVPPWSGTIWMECCDCGLSHYFVPDHSGTAVRPAAYDYRWRFGNFAWTDPDPALGLRAMETFRRVHCDAN